MAQNVAFGIANDGAVGTSPLALRKCLSSLFQNNGIMNGLTVTGMGNLTYNVAAGAAIVSRNTNRADGCSWAAWDGGTTPAVTANNTSYGRIDTVWICARDKQQGDSSNYVEVGVTQGTPAASPVAPAAPSYATTLAHMLLPAGATSTSSARSQNVKRFYAVPYGASLGVIVDNTYTAQNEWLRRYTEKPVATATFSLPTARVLSVGMTVSVQADGCEPDLYWAGSGYVQWYLDNQKIRTFRFNCNPYSVSCMYFEDERVVSAGTHTIKMSVWGSTTRPVSDLYLCYGGNDNWPGQRLLVTDLGIASS